MYITKISRDVFLIFSGRLFDSTYCKWRDYTFHDSTVANSYAYRYTWFVK